MVKYIYKIVVRARAGVHNINIKVHTKQQPGTAVPLSRALCCNAQYSDVVHTY